MEKFIETSISDHVASIRLNRPDLHNAFNEFVVKELARAFLYFGQDPEVRAVLLSASGKSFCAGADLNWMRRMVDYTFEENLEDALALAEMFRAVAECPKPVVARVQGAAYGGGVGLVAACDAAVGLSSATFALSEVKLGILPATILPHLMQKIGHGALRRYALTAESFGAEEAWRIGLLSEVAETEEELNARVAGICAAIKKNSPQAVSACKKLLREMSGKSAEEARELTSLRIAEIRVSQEGQEGLKAFLEKRKPSWQI